MNSGDEFKGFCRTNYYLKAVKVKKIKVEFFFTITKQITLLMVNIVV